jgi:hypothetical protein
MYRKYLNGVSENTVLSICCQKLGLFSFVEHVRPKVRPPGTLNILTEEISIVFRNATDFR